MTRRIEWIAEDRALALGREFGILERQAKRGAFRTLANNPPVARALYGLVSELLQRNTLDLRLREMLVLRIGWRLKSAYVWYQHYLIARDQAGLSDAEMLAVRNWHRECKEPLLQPADRAMLAAVDDTVDLGSISDATWAECTRHVPDPAQQVELTVAIGCWMMQSQLFATLGIPLQEGASLWPPDGVAPG
jgi:alkylhydroperoxidase family enzyme